MLCLNMFPIRVAASLCGVCTKTLRRWEKKGRIKPKRTSGGHRRYTLSDLINAELISNHLKQETNEKSKQTMEKSTIIYARVSSHKQKKRGDLQRQQECLEIYCKNHNITRIIKIADVGSGLNTKRRGLKKLFQLVRKGNVAQILISFKDRLTRFGFNYIKSYCNLFGVEITAVKSKPNKSVQEELVEDMMSLI
ncbi:MAG: IS607 family transposase, partial [Candidatus Lokiarchaeota archaeon]|nr:IS607 family transposase [Candidatus Lokiarchaeota archaeon]